MPKHRINLGDKVRDEVSGFEGVAVARIEWLYGCERIVVQPAAKDGVLPSDSHFDEPQLEIVEKKKRKSNKSKDIGGPLNINYRK